jgi:hypothetical protein
MSDRFLGQRIYIKFWVKLGENSSDIYALLSKAYVGKCMKHSNVFECYKQFKFGSHFEITNED